MSRRAALTIGLLALALLLAALLRLTSSSAFDSAGGLLDWPDATIHWDLRGRRCVAAIAIGLSLAVAGVLLQSILRNPLASPFILGLTSGAGLGIVIAMYVGFAATGAIVASSAPLGPALLGAFGALALVYTLSQRRGLIDPSTLILVGVIVSVVCGAVGTFFQHLLPDAGMAVYTRWVMGSISEDSSWWQLGLVASIGLIGTALAAWLGPALDAASLSDDEARSVGVQLGPLRLAAFGLAGLLTAGTVVLAGPIAFVGLICPHLVRLLAGPKHRALIIGAALAGAVLILLADIAVTLLRLPSGRLPIGVLTSLIGGPVFIMLLRRSATNA
jgi:iron complex transport system permease protein